MFPVNAVPNGVSVFTTGPVTVGPPSRIGMMFYSRKVQHNDVSEMEWCVIHTRFKITTWLKRQTKRRSVITWKRVSSPPSIYWIKHVLTCESWVNIIPHFKNQRVNIWREIFLQETCPQHICVYMFTDFVWSKLFILSCSTWQVIFWMLMGIFIYSPPSRGETPLGWSNRVKPKMSKNGSNSTYNSS
jgi:hypothetical protein